MGFFDLNIPYHESDKRVADKSARKTARLKLIVKAMELGYTGVAYNRSIKGFMSESDRCATPLFPLSSVLKLAPSLSAAVNLHRDVLGVPASAPFRQYTRLTVAVDSSSQASALNSGNPILKTYDIVAVRPLNQNAFEQACQGSEVNLISIDFSEKLPFRLKQPIVKAAIERGLYFEITYSGLVMDAHVRRQVISNAKLLVDWTRGKNLILSSAATSVTELRGPFDVANLSMLLGLSTEHAKAALSKNCRSLIVNALRKKYYYKEAIRVEVISSGEQVDSKERWSNDWLKWDPISSGDGDLLLDDMAKSFSASTKPSKAAKAIDFASVMDSFSSSGLQVQDLKSATETTMQQCNIGTNKPTAVETEVSIADTELLKEPKSLDDLRKVNQNSPYNSSLQLQTNNGDSMKSFLPNDALGDIINAEGIITDTPLEEPKNANGLDVHFSPLGNEMHKLQSQSLIASCDAHTMSHDHNATLNTAAMDTEIVAACNVVADAENFIQLNGINFAAIQSEDSKCSSRSDAVLATEDNTVEEVLIETNTEVKEDLSITLSDVSLCGDSLEREQIRETRDDPISATEVLPTIGSYDEMKDNVDHFVANHEPTDEVAMEEQKQSEDHAEINTVEEVLIETNTEFKEDLSITLSDVSLHGHSIEREQLTETRDDPVSATEVLPTVGSYDEMKDNVDHFVENHEPPDEVAMEEQKQSEEHAEINYPLVDDSLGKRKVKQRTRKQAFLFPLKRLLNPTHFKRKAKNSKTKTKLL